MRRLLTLVVVLAVVLVSGTAAVAAPRADPRSQLDWFVEASTRAPIDESEQREHLSPTFLDSIGGPAEFNRVLTQVGPLALHRILRSTPTLVEAVTSQFVTTLAVGPDGLVQALGLRPYVSSPKSWSELDSRLRTLAPRVSFSASVVSDGCRPVHEVNGTAVRPLGSAFKLYVLAALSRAVTEGRANWDQSLPIREAWKSLPSGVLQDEPAGTEVSLRRHANLMISISDNTATDHLMHFLGRPAVHREMVRFGNRHVANKPLLTTRELFALKGFHYPALADTYLSLPRGLRGAVLPAVASVPRERIEPWTEPRHIDTLEWFGSTRDMCRALAGLRSSHDPAVDAAMSLSDGGIALDREDFPTVWYKGGSEPGVLVLNHLAETADGRTVVASVLLADPDGSLDPNVAAEALALVRGGLELA